MKKIVKFGLMFLVIGSLTSCVMMSSATVSDVKPASGEEIKVTASGFGILTLTVPKGIAKDAAKQLRDKGAVGNVTTVMSMRNWGIVQYYRVTATGTK